MNTIALDNKRDLPLTTDLLKAMQDAYSQLEALAAVVVPNQVAILTGCTDRGGSVDAGMMIFSGKIVPFKGGAKQTMVRLVSSVTVHEVGAGNYEHTAWYAEFGVSPEGRHIPWEVIKQYAWQSLNALTGQLNELAQTNASQNQSQEGKIDSINSALSARIAATENKNTEQDGRLDTLGAENGARYAEIQQLRSDASASIDGLSNRITSVETDSTDTKKSNAYVFSSFDNRIGTLETALIYRASNIEEAIRYIPQVLFTGNVSKAGALENVRKHPDLPSSVSVKASRKTEGGYQVEWTNLSLGTRHDYMVIVNTDQYVNIGVRCIYKTAGYFQVTFADDTTLNDAQFDFMVISQIYNP